MTTEPTPHLYSHERSYAIDQHIRLHHGRCTTQEMADHLGIPVETVIDSQRRMRQNMMILAHRRQIQRIVDRQRLEIHD